MVWKEVLIMEERISFVLLAATPFGFGRHEFHPDELQYHHEDNRPPQFTTSAWLDPQFTG